MDELARQAEDQRRKASDQKSEHDRIAQLIQSNESIGKAVIEAAKAQINAHDIIATRTAEGRYAERSTNKDSSILAKKMDVQINAIQKLAKAIENARPVEAEPPVVNVSPPEVNVAPPVVNVAPPKVSVAAPIVNVAGPDLSPLLDTMDEMKALLVALNKKEAPIADTSSVEAGLNSVKKAITGLRFPVPNFIQDPLIAYTPADIDDASGIQYFGYTQMGDLWYIRKFDTIASPKTLRFCFGRGSYTTNWTNRAALTYTIWGT